MTLPQRKATRLKDFDYRQPGIYFITICAKNRRCLFGSISPLPVGDDACIVPHAEPSVRLSPLGKIVQKYLQAIPGMTVCVVMPNHLHCMITVPATDTGGPMQASAPTISQRIRIFKGQVTRAAAGSVFQRSFYDHIVRNEEEYREIYDYILTNPARWAMDKFYTEGEVFHDCDC